MTERLALGLIPGVGWSAREIQMIAREAEDASGFEAEAALMEQGVGLASLTDRLLDSVCLFGPVSRCREQMTVFRTAGIDLPILVPPIGVEGAQAVIQAFRR